MAHLPDGGPAAWGSQSPASWLRTNTYRAETFPLEKVLETKDASIAAVLPAKEVARTLGAILRDLMPLRSSGLIDELVVVDASSEDGTADIATEEGAVVVQRDEVLGDLGPALGKGDALWRGAFVTSSDILVFMDTDTRNFGQHFLLGLLGPLFQQPELHFVKGAFRRPFKLGDRSYNDEGGRVTELVARPHLNLHLPQLAGFVQPLAGEVAIRRWLFGSLSIPVGYGVEIAMLIDSWRKVGLQGMAQVDLGSREDEPQSLRDLSAMAYAVAGTILRRVGLEVGSGAMLFPSGDTLEIRTVPTGERPPLDSLSEDDVAGM